tara:strand:- start:244 stop:699 length:456 start_codon:yes stop_codon:yes gene_type:complete
MNSVISKKMDMVAEVFRRDKYRSDVLQLLQEEWVHPLNRMEEWEQEDLFLLTENKKPKKNRSKENHKRVRIKNNKGEFVDIGKQKNNEPHYGMVEFPPDDTSNLIQVGGVAGWEEGRKLLKKIKKGRKTFSDFMRTKPRSSARRRQFNLVT